MGVELFHQMQASWPACFTIRLGGLRMSCPLAPFLAWSREGVDKLLSFVIGAPIGCEKLEHIFTFCGFGGQPSPAAESLRSFYDYDTQGRISSDAMPVKFASP